MWFNQRIYILKNVENGKQVTHVIEEKVYCTDNEVRMNEWKKDFIKVSAVFSFFF